MLRKYIGFVIIALIPNILPAATYQITDVIKTSNGFPVKINNNGIVSGSVQKDSQTLAFLYDSKNGETIFLSAFDSEHTYALDINNRDEVVGFSYQEDFSPTQGKMTLLVPYTYSNKKSFSSLRSTLGHMYCDYTSIKINDLGWIAGYGFIDSNVDRYKKKGNFRPHYSSLIFNGKNALVLNHPSSPDNFGVCIKSINNHGDVAGGVFYNSGQHAYIGSPSYSFLWDSVQKNYFLWVI